MRIASLSQQAPKFMWFRGLSKATEPKEGREFFPRYQGIEFRCYGSEHRRSKAIFGDMSRKRPHRNAILVQGLDFACLGPDNAARGGGNRRALPSFVAVILFKINLVEPLAPANRGPIPFSNRTLLGAKAYLCSRSHYPIPKSLMFPQ